MQNHKGNTQPAIDQEEHATVGGIDGKKVFVFDNAGNQIINFGGETPATLGTGQQNVTTAGSRIQLSLQACKSVIVKANSTNTGLIYIGSSTVSSSNGLILSSGENVAFDISNVNKIYIDSSVNGEGISYLWISS